MEIDYKDLLAKAEEFSKKGSDWHHHYLPPGCSLNTSNKHLIILEAEGDKWQSTFDQKPMEDLEKLEKLFFKRV